MEICLVECLQFLSKKYEPFGVFSSQGKAIEALRDNGKDTARITILEIDIPYKDGVENSVLYSLYEKPKD